MWFSHYIMTNKKFIASLPLDNKKTLKMINILRAYLGYLILNIWL